MRVRAKKAAPRKGQVPPPQPTQTYVFPAPTKGWVLNENLALVSPGSARILDNWICTTTGIRVRGGSTKYATLSTTGGVTHLMTYKSGATEEFYGCTADSIFDITTVADPDSVPTADVTGQTSGDYSSTQFGTVSGDYLYAVNGADKLQLYDGATWTAIDGVSSPAITGVTTSNLSFAWSFGSRMFFVEKDTLTAWYLPVDSIGGAAASFSLAGIFKRGGSLLFGATWSIDAGDGLDDKCVFVSTEGEVAIYEGTNPASATDWRKAGVYHIAKPMGKNAATHAGGDLLIATEIGVVPLSQAIQKDVVALSLGAVTAPIEPYWREIVNEQTTQSWEVLKWSANNMMVVSTPDVGPDEGACLTVNLHTGAWSRITGWDTQCLGAFGDGGYFGTSGGLVLSMETGGSDNGANYTCSYLGQHEGLQAPGHQKTAKLVRATFSSATPIDPKVSALTNHSETLSSAPASVANFTNDTWDSGLWDTAVWDAGLSAEASSVWRSVGRTGYTIAPEVQLTFGVTPKPAAELVSVELTYSVGALVA